MSETTMAGCTVLVTGGTGGIGKATALGLATLGAHVAITGRDEARAVNAAEEIRSATGVQVEVFVADLSAQTEVRRLAGEVHRRFSRLDVLVIPAPGPTTSPSWPTSCSPTSSRGVYAAAR